MFMICAVLAKRVIPFIPLVLAFLQANFPRPEHDNFSASIRRVPPRFDRLPDLELPFVHGPRNHKLDIGVPQPGLSTPIRPLFLFRKESLEFPHNDPLVEVQSPCTICMSVLTSIVHGS